MVAWIQLGKHQAPQLGSLSLQSYQSKPVRRSAMLWVGHKVPPGLQVSPIPSRPAIPRSSILLSPPSQQPCLNHSQELSQSSQTWGGYHLHNTWYSAQRMYNKKRFVRENNPSFCHAIAVAIIRESFSYANLLLSGDLPSHHPGRRP
jgi:hypothetical protein